MKKNHNVIYRREPGTPLTESQLEQLKALEGRPIDTSDILELPASAWKDKVRGRFYRPVKQEVSLRLDADVIAWLKKDGEGYRMRANQMLRERMLAELESQEKSVRALVTYGRNRMTAHPIISSHASDRVTISTLVDRHGIN